MVECKNECWRCRRRFAVRIGRLELSSCDKRLSQDGEQDRAEISCWAENGEHRWVIAAFDPKDEGFDLRSISQRPWSKEVKRRDFDVLVKLGFKLLKRK